ncbi:peptidylglycine alpha-hydroxylating monooxygenase [Nilaparvata lugens]|uniref:peptidylglycine alpha-hydroxylating monooxygenase n=1 Tax=Nilaparvata lugens TaxID=108931 RepID=UPI00193E2591|nr:peptidylglycine alpha-hydroxylating monooxygenase [Nilaparvata lugens]
MYSEIGAMACKHMFLCILLSNVGFLTGLKVERYSLLMPNVVPNKPELYLCTPIKVNYTKNYYIVGFEPKASMDVAHHILLYGCTVPGSSDPVWDCGEMSNDNSDDNRVAASPCEQGSQVIYAWARDAPMLKLPEDVGFEVGGQSPIQYLVLQVHYAHIDSFKDGSTDDSGIFLHYTEEPMKRLAGVILLGTSGMIPPMSTEHMEAKCQIKENKTIHPFAFRTHTHSLGKVVSGYRVRSDENGDDEWTLLGKHDPLKPQMFYPVENDVMVKPNDILAARCTMESHRQRVTYIGGTNKDEMCNFYVMYWVEGTTPLDQKYCFSRGPPFYYWHRDASLNHIPHRRASSLI